MSKSFDTILFLVVVHDTEQLSLEKQIELSTLLKTKKVNSNGKLTIRCMLRCNLRETKLKIADIIKDMLINKRTAKDIESIPKDKLNLINECDLSKMNLGFIETEKYGK